MVDALAQNAEEGRGSLR